MGRVFSVMSCVIVCAVITGIDIMGMTIIATISIITVGNSLFLPYIF